MQEIIDSLISRVINKKKTNNMTSSRTESENQAMEDLQLADGLPNVTHLGQNANAKAKKQELLDAAMKVKDLENVAWKQEKEGTLDACNMAIITIKCIANGPPAESGGDLVTLKESLYMPIKPQGKWIKQNIKCNAKTPKGRDRILIPAVTSRYGVIISKFIPKMVLATEPDYLERFISENPSIATEENTRAM